MRFLEKIRIFWNKQQPKDTHWTACLTNKYWYIERSIVVTYLYVKRNKRHVIRVFTEYWICLHWNTRWFVCLLNLVTCSLSPLYTPVYDIIKMCNVLLYICICMCVCIYIYIYIYIHTHTHTYVYVCKYIYICVYIYIYTYTFIHPFRYVSYLEILR